MTCVFCEIIHGRAPSTTLATWFGARVIVPLNPVTPGHLLVIPEQHVADWADRGREEWDERAMSTAVLLAQRYVRENDVGDCNLITSRGPAATQTVGHLHLHIVPRREGDGLTLPWTGQQTDGLEVTRDGDSWRVFDDLTLDTVGVPDRWTDDNVREAARLLRRRAAWYDAVLTARHPAT